MFMIINGCGLWLKWLSAHFDVNLLNLGGKEISDVARDRFLFQEGGLDRLNCRLNFLRLFARKFFDLFPQRILCAVSVRLLNSHFLRPRLRSSRFTAFLR